MKKLFMILVTTLCLTNANAATYLQGYSNGYVNGYNSGHRQGKSDAYNNVARTVFFVAGAMIVGVVIYELGASSKWGYNEKGVTYRF